MFSRCTVPPDSIAIKLDSNNQEASPSAGKNTGVVLVPFSRMQVRPYKFFGSVDLSEDPGSHLLRRMSSQ